MANDFSAAINEIMPLVADGDKSKPFIISRDSAYGDWQVCYPHPAKNAKIIFDCQKAHDPFAVMFTGSDFSKGSGFPYVYDAVLCNRLRVEYFATNFSYEDEERLPAFLSFFAENTGNFSHTVTAYLTTLERPLAALAEMCPFDMTTNHEGWNYNEVLAADAIELIENAVRDHLHINVDNPEPERQALGEYKELNRISVNQSDMILSENPDAEYRYMVIENRYTPYYNNLGNNNIFTGHTNDYLEAIDEFSERVQYNIRCFKSSWEAFAERDEEQDKQKSSPAKKHTLQEKLDNAKQKAAMNDAAKNNNRGDKPKTHDGRE